MRVSHWTAVVPVLGVLSLGATWSLKDAPIIVLVFVGILLAGSVLAAVHHAEVVAHRVGEPFGSLVLAVAVTVIEVALIVTLMVAGGDDTATLARDTVFAAVMITATGIVGLSLLAATLRHRVATFNAEGTATALATRRDAGDALPGRPHVHDQPSPGPSSRARSSRSPPSRRSRSTRCSWSCRRSGTATTSCRRRRRSTPHRPPTEPRLMSLGFLFVALVAVVGLAKVESPAIEDAVESVGAPHSAVGVVIALLVLAPESLAAYRNARADRMQTSFNLALGSAMASIGLTIPVIAIATIWLDGPLILGLESMQTVLFAITMFVTALTVLPGRATLQESGVHLALFAAFIFLAFNP